VFASSSQIAITDCEMRFWRKEFFSMKAKTFADLEKAEIVTLEELKTSLEDYAAGGWAIWLIVNLVNLITYFSLVDKGVWIAFAPITSTVVVSMIFFVSLIKGKFTKFNLVDTVSLVYSYLCWFFLENKW
jgi:hypothetical protein